MDKKGGGVRVSMRAAVWAGVLGVMSLALQSGASAADAPLIKPPVYWFHVMTNINNDEATQKVYALMERAAKAGYTGISLFDSRFLMKEFQTPEYIAKVKKFRQKASELHLAIAGCMAPLGYGEEMLHYDINLVEGMPVRNAVFVAKEGKLVPFDPDVHLTNGNFENWKGDAPANWDIDDAGKNAFKDETVKYNDKPSLRTQEIGNSPYKHSRLIQQFKVQPWHNYHLSVMVKTDHCTNRDIRIMPLSKNPLNWSPLPIKETMDWTRLHITFNSQDNTTAGIYMGTWDGRAGKMWWADVQIEPAGFVNIIRRENLPLTITSEDGKTTFEEGKDFGKIVDPGLSPSISGWHQPPVVAIPAGSKIKDGQKVLASFNHAITNFTSNNAAICMSEPKTYEAIKEQVRFLKENLQPDFYFMQHDEIRQCGFDDPCAKRNLTCGQILADNIAKCCKIIEEGDPGKPMVVWNDMFDPFHNAKKFEDDGKTPFAMYINKGDGPWWESWKGMPKNLGVVNWNNGNVKSVKFFDGEHHQQILSHDDPAKLAQWLDETADCNGVVGIMYTTWEDNWGPLEKYVTTAKEWMAKHPRK